MRKKLVAALLSILSLPAQSVQARETVLSTGISTGIDYSDRTYDDDAGTAPLPAPPSVSLGVVDFSYRDDDRSYFVISPFISLHTKSSKDAAILRYQPDINYDLLEGETGDLNHRASAGFLRALSENMDFRVYNSFVDTDRYETTFTGDAESRDNEFVDELLAKIPSMDDRLRDDYGRRRYARNELDLSVGYAYSDDGRVVLGYGWDYLRYDEDDVESGTYQDYDKHSASLAAEHEISEVWTVRGYGQYLRGLYGNADGSDDDLDEYHLGLLGETRIMGPRPLSLSYDFSAADYDDETVDTSFIHKLTLGYQFVSRPELDVQAGVGPTYTVISDSEDSWNLNGRVGLRYRFGQGSVRLSSDLGTMFENFSGTEDRGLTDYWRSRVEVSYPLSASLEGSAYGGYSDETRSEIEYESEYDVEIVSAGGALKYRLSDDYDVGLVYDYTRQDSGLAGDSYDEHAVRLMLSCKTDLFTW